MTQISALRINVGVQHVWLHPHLAGHFRNDTQSLGHVLMTQFLSSG